MNLLIHKNYLQNRNSQSKYLLLTFMYACSFSCSLQKKINTTAKKILINNTNFQTAHIGISIYEPATNTYWYNYQSNKYFVPASNTKIFTCYAAMKYLGDSLTGVTYAEQGDKLYILPTADPTFLHPDFTQQPVINFLQKTKKSINIITSHWKDEAFGAGWAWDDFNGAYMPEKSIWPVYGNLIKFVQTQTEEAFADFNGKPQATIYTQPEINWKLKFNTDTTSTFSVARNKNENIFTITQGNEKYKEVQIPFVTNGIQATIELLKDTTKTEIIEAALPNTNLLLKTILSQATDSVLKPMMHRSDNFFAEQTLLMVSNKLLHAMATGKIIDSLLKTDFADMPQKPTWADGSGLSRYNLFTPNNFVWVLNKMKKDFTWNRITTILPTGNKGTLTNYYTTDSSYIYAKTGTLSGAVCLSGYLITKKNKTLIFSVLVNNHQTTSRTVRRAIEIFLKGIREKY